MNVAYVLIQYKMHSLKNSVAFQNTETFLMKYGKKNVNGKLVLLTS